MCDKNTYISDNCTKEIIRENKLISNATLMNVTDEDIKIFLKKMLDDSIDISPKKEKKTRKRVFSEEQKQKLRQQLINAREAKKAKKLQEKATKKETKKIIVEPKQEPITEKVDIIEPKETVEVKTENEPKWFYPGL